MEVSKLNSQSYSPENTITAQSALTLLAEASKYGIVDIEGVLKEIEMKKNKEKHREEHPEEYLDKYKVKYKGVNV